MDGNGFFQRFNVYSDNFAAFQPPAVDYAPKQRQSYTKFNFMPLPYMKPQEVQFQHLRYLSREFLYRAEEQAKVKHQMNFQQAKWRDILAEDTPVPLYVPKDPYYCFNPPMNYPFAKNKYSKTAVQREIQNTSARLQTQLTNFQQQHQAINNRLNQLQVLLQENLRPSEVMKSELQRKNKYQAQSSNLYQNTIAQLSAEQLFITLADSFKQQFQTQELSPHFERTLHQMSQFYLQIFAKLGITEDDIKLQTNFENLIYYKVHSRQSNEVVKQPGLIKNVTLKPYQIDCLQFLISMYNSNVLHSQAALGKHVQGVSLADDMGLGKTLQTIAFMLHLHERRMAQGMHLIISPLPVSENWEKEFKSFSSNFNVIVYKGAEREKIRQDILARQGYYNCIITTYDYVIQDKAFFKKFAFDCVVVDEASRIKNGKSKLITVLRNEIVCRFRLLLSGTPLQNNIRELFTLLQFIHGTVFEDFSKFEAVFGRVFQKVQQDISESEESVDNVDAADTVTGDNETETEITTAEVTTQSTTQSLQFADNEKLFIIYRLHGIIKPYMIRRIKADVLDQLPPKDEIIIRVPLSGFQQYLYQLSVNEAGRIIQTDQFFQQQANAAALPKSFIRNVDMYLRKVCNHPYLGVEGDQFSLLYKYVSMQAERFEQFHKDAGDELYQRQEKQQREMKQKEDVFGVQIRQHSYLQNIYFGDALSRYSGKLALLSQLLFKLKQSNHRVLIFSQFKLVLNLLADFMEYKGYKYMKFDGDVKDVDRNRMVHSFNAQDSKYFVFLLSTRAASHGLNLQSADTVIIYDCDFNAFYDLQAQDRVYRIGQTHHVKVVKLYTTTTLEQKILDIANSKLHMARSILDAGVLSSQQNQKFSKREFLLELLNSTEDHSDADLLTSAQINRLLARGEQEVQMFDQIDGVLWEEFQQKYSFELRNTALKGLQISDFLIKNVPEIFLQNSSDLQTLLYERYTAASDVKNTPKKQLKGSSAQAAPFSSPKSTELYQFGQAFSDNGQPAENSQNASDLAESLQQFDGREQMDADAFMCLWNLAQYAQTISQMVQSAQLAARARAPQTTQNSRYLRFAAADIISHALTQEELAINILDVLSGPLRTPEMIVAIRESMRAELISCQVYCSAFDLQSFVLSTPQGCTSRVYFNAALLKLQESSMPRFVSGGLPSRVNLNFHARLLAIMHLLLAWHSERNLVQNTAIEQPLAESFWVLPTPVGDAAGAPAFPLSLRMIWFKAITLQYTSLTEFLAEIRLLSKNVIAFVPKATTRSNIARSLQDKAVTFAKMVFDCDDVEQAVSQLEDTERRYKVTQTGYFLTAKDAGFAAVDCDDIKDEITRYLNYQIVSDTEPQFSFGSGVYGGGILEKMVCPLIDYMRVE